MHTYTLLVKGSAMHTHAQLTLHMRGIMHRVTNTHVGDGETTFYVEVSDDAYSTMATRLNQWFVEDAGLNPPYPNGSLLHWSYQPDTDLDPETRDTIASALE